MGEQKLKVTGMDCPTCASGLETSLLSVDGVTDVRRNTYDGTLVVQGDVNPGTLRQYVQKLGYDVVDESEPVEQAELREGNALLGFWRYLLQSQETRLALLAGAIVLLSFAAGPLGLPGWVPVGMQLVALGLAGWPIARSGLVHLWVNHRLNINFLMTIAGIGAVIIGEYVEAASLVLLFNLAEALEGYTNARARNTISQLTALTPTEVIRLDADGESLVPVEAVLPGDRMVVKPGERIALDGKIVDGQSDINQAPITGESMPVWKGQGEPVFSGSVNGQGRLIVEVTHLVADSTLQRIVEMVTEAQERQSLSQRFIDRFAQFYTPAMVLLALLVAVVPPLVWGAPFLNLADGTRGWLHRALVLLVISCPCALVISTPVTMVASLTHAARQGVLFKGGVFIEALARMDTFAFDKTGTLTEGNPKVVATRSVDCDESGGCAACDDLIGLAYALERHSTHPLAQAIADEAEKRGVANLYPAARGLTTRSGRGLEGTINEQLMTIGSLRLFEEEHHIPPNVRQWVAEAEAKGNTAMLLCDGERVRGFIAVADTPRVEAERVIAALGEMGKRTVMLTGDNATVAASVAESVGLDEVRASLLPGDKLEVVNQIKTDGARVAMVGDGINDAPALAAADLGIAVGGLGSAQAMETADIVLLGANMAQLPFAVRLSRFTNLLVRQNITFSLLSKLIVAGIAFLGYFPLWLAVLADMGVSLLVTLNGLRALRFELNK